MTADTDFELSPALSARLGADAYTGPQIHTHGLIIHAIWAEGACGVAVRGFGTYAREDVLFLDYEQACALANAFKHVLPNLARLREETGGDL
ncbi:hypothetical protein [Arthrobacter wenxiniae]|uniref:Uncharacterized protein n=1 Tax=Arthrobacter wenxiniae TaxID=2713570 RepID=A0A7Y7LXV0_9MICC|nr:hypothetical protein [Arthrobacter wenxiniae]NVM94765.1 hypothetical protein [Arthrobacter wenxiniae]